MEIFVINTPNGLPVDQVREVFKDLGNVHVIAQYSNENQLKDAFPLTFVSMEKGKSIDPVGLKVQHLAAWEQIMQRDLPGAIVVLDTVRFVNSFVKSIEHNHPKNADICIFSATNLRINGIHINGTDWALLDSDDETFNNICNAYYITGAAAKKLYARRNEMLNDAKPFGLFINSVSHYMALDRVATYMSMQATSSKPIYIAPKIA